MMQVWGLGAWAKTYARSPQQLSQPPLVQQQQQQQQHPHLHLHSHQQPSCLHEKENGGAEWVDEHSMKAARMRGMHQGVPPKSFASEEEEEGVEEGAGAKQGQVDQVKCGWFRRVESNK
jgi:hypothetical protein